MPKFAALTLACILAPAAAAQPIAELIGDNIARFHASPEARDQRLPSMALETPRPAIGTVPEAFSPTPTFTIENERFVATIAIEPGTSLYGTGQAAGQLLRNGRTVETWNLDAYGYGDDSPNLYTAHPWVLAVRADGSAFGVLADTTYRCEVDLTDNIVFRTAGRLDADGNPAEPPRPHPIIIIERDTPQDVMRALGDLCGTIELPPLWALGYHQCRYSYYPDARVREVAQEFRDRNIPCDVIWMDIDYMDGFRCFTFDDNHFPDPADLCAWLDTVGFQNIWMIDPGIKAEDGYFVKDQGDEINAWVQASSGAPFIGDVWPGPCVFPDFTSADVRTWWAGLYNDFMAHGIDGVWNDMNEPAVFNSPTKTMPEANLHNADPEFGGPGDHAQFHNVYGMLMIRATREGVLDANPELRPFVLSRANFIGGHRYGATWTGDNTANWYHVDASIPMTLNLGLSGQPFAGPDIGGFVSNGSPEMYARWMGFGALLPFARGHTGKGNVDKEPWAFGQDVEDTCRRAIERRYRLLPYIYTLFRESSLTGMPVARPTFFADPTDAALRSEDDSFLLGDKLLVVADPTPARERAHVLPAGNWRELHFPDFNGVPDNQDPDLPRLFVAPGSIIPTGPVMQHTRERHTDPLTLVVSLDESGFATGELYEDEGDGFGYQDGFYKLTRFDAVAEGETLVIHAMSETGDMPRIDRHIDVRVLMDNGVELRAHGHTGRPIHLRIR